MMKTIGLIGGMSWESTLEYYRLLNETVHDRLGGFHSAKCVLVSVDFAEIEQLQNQNRWDEATQAIVEAATQLDRAGAEIILLCTNTMHICAPGIQTATRVPFLHIADATASAVKAQNLSKVGLLGTRFTMEGSFIRDRLAENFSLTVLVPDKAEMEQIHRIIYDELVQGVILEKSRQVYIEIIDHLIARGAQGIILGCTEIGLLIRQEDISVPVFDTTRIHALAAIDFSLG
jgi:aspartate racemase